MKSEKESFSKNQESSILEFSISRFHLIRHIFALIFTVGLCLSLLMSEIFYYSQKHGHIHAHALHSEHLGHMIVPYLLLLVIATVIATTTILTACKIKISKEIIEISSLFRNEQLSRMDLQAFASPANSKFAWLKTRHCFYLLHKNEFKNWLKLEQVLNELKRA